MRETGGQIPDLFGVRGVELMGFPDRWDMGLKVQSNIWKVIVRDNAELFLIQGNEFFTRHLVKMTMHLFNLRTC